MPRKVTAMLGDKVSGDQDTVLEEEAVIPAQMMGDRHQMGLSLSPIRQQ